MRLERSGSLPRIGGVTGALSVGEHVVVTCSRGTERWAVGLRRDGAGWAQAWSHDLVGDASYPWRGHGIWLDRGGAVGLPGGRVALVGGRERLVVTADGRVETRAEGVAASAPPALVDGLLLIPERAELAAYDPDDLTERWRRPTPWAALVCTSAVGDVVGISHHDRDPAESHLWWYGAGATAALGFEALWHAPLPVPLPLDGAAVAAGRSAAVVAEGSSAATVVTAVGPEGQELWRIPRGAPAFPQAPRPALTGQLLPGDGVVWCAVAEPAVLAIDPVDGAVRADVPLPADATAMALTGDALWVGTADGEVLQIEDAEVVARAVFDPGGAERLSLLLPLGPGLLGIGSLGSLVEISA